MNQTLRQSFLSLPAFYFPIFDLLHPRQYTRRVLLALGLGTVAGWGIAHWLGAPLWMSTFVVLLVLMPVGVQKWREDRRRYGATIMLLSIVLTTQGVHTVEHFAQWTQYHILYWTMRQSNGLLSPANAEWVHFVWNWLVLLVIVLLMVGGMRNIWAYVLLLVALTHTIEHTYLFVRYLEVLAELRKLGVDNVTAQGLAGIVGRDGWLARCSIAQLAFARQIPGLTTAIRLDVHFWWNALEMFFLVVAGHVFLARRWRTLIPGQ
ncbi:MAG: hypothetical protein R3C14_30105 [Caldilineaceae bacterium]